MGGDGGEVEGVCDSSRLTLTLALSQGERELDNMKNIILKILKFYKTNPVVRAVMMNFPMNLFGCRYQPTCSEYMYDAVKKYGVGKGIYLGSFRILRCNPWAKGGFDPVK